MYMLFKNLLFISLDLHYTKFQVQHHEYIIIYMIFTIYIITYKAHLFGHQSINIEIYCAWRDTCLKPQNIFHITFVYKSVWPCCAQILIPLICKIPNFDRSINITGKWFKFEVQTLYKIGAKLIIQI